jgi:hypothetical protein
MAFPTGTSIDTTNLDSGTDDPSLARGDLYNAVVALNNIIASADTADGVALLNASNKYDSTKFPTTIAVTGTQTIAPTSGVVNIQDVIRLTALTATSISSLPSPQLGDIAISTNADGGSPAVCFYDGADWTYLGFGNLTVL